MGTVLAQANADGDAAACFRQKLLCLHAYPCDAEAKQQAAMVQRVPEELAAAIVLCNTHGFEPLHDTPAFAFSRVLPAVGIWPLGALINHSLHPNVVRFFVGHALCFRLVRVVNQGDEILDNYLDPRLPRQERESFLASRHHISDEGPDCFDAPDHLFNELEHGLTRINELLTRGHLEDAHHALVHITGRCKACKQPDPAFTDILWAFADIASQLLHDNSLCLECLVVAFHYLTMREPVSVVSCRLAAELTLAALEVSNQDDSKARAHCRQQFEREYGPTPTVIQAEKTARDHIHAIYGPEVGIFELINPKIVQNLRRVTSTCLQSNKHTFGEVTKSSSLDEMD